MRLPTPALLAALLLAGCATDLKPVRDFADETRKIGNAFGPVLHQLVIQCQQQFLERRLYTSDAPLAGFDPAAAIQQAADACKPIADEAATATSMSKALADYGDRLSALAAGGVASSLNDDYDALAGKIGEFKDVPKQAAGLIGSLLKFISKNAIAQSQRDAIAEALGHEEAVGVLADALVVYAERVYGAYVSERIRDQALFLDVLRAETAAPISSRLRMVEVHRHLLRLQAQRESADRLKAAVSQMKASMRDLRQNADRLSDNERHVEVRKLSTVVRSLYQQLNQAF